MRGVVQSPVIEYVKGIDLMADRRAQEGSEKKVSDLAVDRSAAKSFSLATGNCLERALRRTTEKIVSFSEKY
jgi:hypothetical protein